MKSIVCVKRVPESDTRVRIAGDGRSLDPAGVKFTLNPYDEFALEEAIARREAADEGSVTAISVGDDASEETLRTALAMGADDAVLLRTDAEPTPSDGRVVARALAEEIRGREFDLLLFGKQAIDDDNMQVPAMVAEILDLPCATVVVEMEVEDGRLVAVREVEGGHERVEAPLPAAVSTQKGLNEPRYASLKGIMAAKKKPLDVKDVELTGDGLELLDLEEPPEPAAGEIVGEGPEAAAELARRLREEAKVL